MGDVVRRNWRFWVVLAEILVLVFLFAHHVERHDDQTRQSLCAVLDRIPEHLDSGMDRARTLDRCGPPHPPSVFFGRPFPTPHPTVTVRPTPEPQPTVVIRLVPATTRPPSSSPLPSHTAPPRPTPRPTPTDIPTEPPSPSPTSLCVLFLCP